MRFRSRHWLLVPALMLGQKADAKAVGWEAWYLVETKDQITAMAYRDKVSTPQGKLQFQNDLWRKEEGYLNEEHLGAFAEDSAGLKPLFFNFRSKYRSDEKQIDGNMQPDGSLVVKVTETSPTGKNTLPTIRTTPSKKSFFSVFFPVWVMLELPKLKEGQSQSFLTIQEDDVASSFSTVTGRVQRDKPDAFATKTHTTKLSVDYRGTPSTWWVNDKGIAERIELTGQGLVARKVTAAEAQKFTK